jgi:CheY-like chemotaxis protein
MSPPRDRESSATEVLIVAGERGEELAEILRRVGHTPVVADGVSAARKLIGRRFFAVAVAEADLADGSAVDLATGSGSLPLIVVDLGASAETVATAGVDLVLRPGSDQELRSVLPAAVGAAAAGSRRVAALEARLRRLQRYEAVGALAGGITHEFNNILYVIMGFAELAQMRAASGRPVDAQLAEVVKATGLAKDLVAQLLALIRSSEQERRALLLQPTVKETLKLVRAGLPSSVEVEHHVDANCGPVVADPAQIYQLVLTMCILSSRSLPDFRGVLEVRMQPVDLDAGDARRRGVGGQSEYVQLLVTTAQVDGADGLLRTEQPEDQARRDELEVLDQIVTAHGGHLQVAGSDGGRSQTEVLLPVERPATRVGSPTEDALPRGSEHILCVDDDVAVREMLEQLLTALGYRVTAVASGASAIQLLEDSGADVDLLLTDQSMPGLSGAEIIEAGRTIRPELPTILCTGFAEQIDGGQAARHGVDRVVAKPVGAAVLARSLRELLDG